MRPRRRAESELPPAEERPWRAYAACPRPDVVRSALAAVPDMHPERFWLEVQSWPAEHVTFEE